MKRGIKILVTVISVILLIIISFIVVTALQIKKIADVANDPEFTKGLEALANGDCTKLPLVETKFKEIESTLKSVCINPVVKALINNYAKETVLRDKDLCDEIKKPDNEFRLAIKLTKTNCNRQA
jgi:hypothetical protein